MENEIKAIKSLIKNPNLGLGTDLLHFVSELTPLVNVDLLIQKKIAGKIGTLLTWREDNFYRGWHFPGGIIRYKETMSERVKKVALNELGVENLELEGPINLEEIINFDRSIRGHFISLLFRCNLKTEPTEALKFINNAKITNGVWKYHNRIPKDLLKQHLRYIRYFHE